MPIVRISQAIKALQAGDLLRVKADDPAFEADVQAWARKTGHELIELSGQGLKTATLRKVGPAA